jgi:hypothetical protein
MWNLVRLVKRMLLWVRIACAEDVLRKETEELDMILQERWIALDAQDSKAYVLLTCMRAEVSHEVDRLQTRRDGLALQLERLYK